jgi:hypothetical protein
VTRAEIKRDAVTYNPACRRQQLAEFREAGDGFGALECSSRLQTTDIGRLADVLKVVVGDADQPYAEGHRRVPRVSTIRSSTPKQRDLSHSRPRYSDKQGSIDPSTISATQPTYSHTSSEKWPRRPR